MKNIRFDLHSHSIYSDGEDTPTVLVQKAGRAGLAMLALSDHDSIEGVSEAIRAGEREGIRVVPAVELDTEWEEELHILGLGIRIDDPELNRALSQTALRREERNTEIVERLRTLGCEVAGHVRRGEGTTTRFDIALALVSAGYTKSAAESFAKYLGAGAPAYVKPKERPAPEEAIGRIRRAGGVAVLAHPCHLRENPHALIEQLHRAGLAGLEVYYPSSTEGQCALFRSLAVQHGLLITSGSDYHGETRRSVRLGSAWREDAALSATFDFLMDYS